MKCREIIELISAEIDGKLETEKKPEFHHHLKQCPRCRGEFELEQVTKLFITRRLTRATVPAELKEQILRQTRGKINPSSTRESFIAPILRLPKWHLIPAVAGSAAIIIITLLLMPIKKDRFHRAPPNNNIIHQVYNNFHGILEGKLIPAVAYGDPEFVDTYFRGEIQFPVHLPPMPDCTLLGTMFSEYANEGTAHLVYKHNNDIIYIYEVALQDLMNTGGLGIPHDILAEAMKGDLYVENRMPDCSLAIWIHDSTLCCAITHISDRELISYLTRK